jgi:hypothetical protein
LTTADTSPPNIPDPPLVWLVEQLRAERDGLRQAMRTRSLIEQAKGILIARDGVTADEAFARLRQTSQRSNVKLAEVAAELIAQHVPPPAPVGSVRRPRRHLRAAAAGARAPSPADAAGARAPSPADAAAARAPSPDAASAPDVLVRARHLLVTARLDVASDHDEIVAALVETGLGWPVPASVVLTLAEPDGALRVVASRGLNPETASQWRRVPPQVDVPLTAAARTGAPVWLPDPAHVDRAYPLMAAMSPAVAASATLPLCHAGGPVGAVGFSWRTPVTLDEPRRAHLLAAADATARAGARLGLLAVDAGPSWVQTLLEGSLTGAAVMAPVGPADDPVDFRYEHVNRLADEAAERRALRLAGSTLLTIMPELGARILVPLFRAVLADGHPRQLDQVFVAGARPDVPGQRYSVRAVRLGGRIFATWRRHLPGELLYEDLVAAGRVAGVAAFRWQLSDGELRATPNLRELLNWPAGPPPSPRTVLQAVHPAQRAALRAAVLAALRREEPMEMIVAAGRRWLRVTAERVLADDRVVALRGRAQDVTELRAARSREHHLAEARAVRRHRVQFEV